MCLLCASMFAMGAVAADCKSSNKGTRFAPFVPVEHRSLTQVFPYIYTSLDVELKLTLDEPLVDASGQEVDLDVHGNVRLINERFCISVHTDWGLVLDCVNMRVARGGSVVRARFSSECGMLLENMRWALSPKHATTAPRDFQDAGMTITIFDRSSLWNKLSTWFIDGSKVSLTTCGDEDFKVRLRIVLRDRCGEKAPKVTEFHASYRGRELLV